MFSHEFLGYRRNYVEWKCCKTTNIFVYNLCLHTKISNNQIFQRNYVRKISLHNKISRTLAIGGSLTNYLELYRIISNYIELYRIISHYMQLYRIISNYIKLYQIISNYIELYRIISNLYYFLFFFLIFPNFFLLTFSNLLQKFF